MNRLLVFCLAALVSSLASSQAFAQLEGGGKGGFSCPVPSGAPGVLEEHPNGLYFMVKGDTEQKAVVLSGSHVWGNVQSWVGGGSGNLDVTWGSYLNTVLANGHNFVRGWMWEDGDYAHLPFVKNGSLYNLAQLNDAYFQQVCTALTGAAQNDLYISVMLFEGWSIEDKLFNGVPLRNPNPWLKHPFKGGNNSNGVNGDLNNDGRGKEIHTLGAGSTILGYQEAYVRLMVQRFNAFPNLIWEISNESHNGSVAWQNHMAQVIRNEEALLPNQHLIAMNAAGDWSNNGDLSATSADIVSPNNQNAFSSFNSPPQANSASAEMATNGRPVLLDTDHLVGIGGNYVWIWKAFTRGYHPIYMDPLHNLGWFNQTWNPNDSQFVKAREAMGEVLDLVDVANLADMTPQDSSVCSTAYCLADPGEEYIVYQPSNGATFTVNLPAGSYDYTWFQSYPGSGGGGGGQITNHPGGNTAAFNFGGRPVLHIVRTDGPPQVELVASYKPSATSGRQDFVSNTATPTQFSFYYDESLGSFEQRAGGACANGSNNGTYLKVRYEGDPVTSCSIQGSWDAAAISCNSTLLSLINSHTEIVLSTDDYSYQASGGTCELAQPLQARILPGESHWFRLTATVGGQSYVREVRFQQQSPSNPPYVDARLVVSYQPAAGQPRVTEAYTSANSPAFQFYYLEGLGNFAQRPGGPCNTGQNNPTYLKMSYAGETMSSCTFQASWDANQQTCSSGLLSLLNSGGEVLLNTDTYDIDPGTCAQAVPQQIHLMSSGWMRLTAYIGGVAHVRKVSFQKL